MSQSASQRPSSHVCLDEDALVLRAKNDAGLAELSRVCAGCPACEKLLGEVRRVRELERGLRSSFAIASAQPASAQVRGETLLERVRAEGTDAGEHGQLPTIKGYKLVHEVRRGGQGIVYRAVQETTNRPAAIKLLLAGSLASLRERYRFEREIEIASSLRHPHVVAVFDAVATSDGRMGYAMDFIEGQPVDTWGDAQRARQDFAAFRRVALELFAKVCRAVQYAHSRGVMHRDLKPSNVLVDAGNEPRVLDFGLARERRVGTLAGTAEGPRSVTMSGEFVGTPQYAAPEQLEIETSEVDGRADVYALGVMLYRLLCGRLPYVVEGSLRSMIDIVCNRPVARPSIAATEAGVGAIDRDLETIVMKALAKDRERRYQTALELAQDIELYLRGAAINARRESTTYVLGKWLLNHKVEAFLGLAAACAVVGGGIGWVVLSARAADARMREASERAQRQEQAIRAEAVAAVVAEILPPPDQSTDSPPARWLEENLLDLREAIDAGWLSDRPELAAQVQSVLSDIYALRGTRSGWYAEAAARNAKALLREAYGENDPRVLRMREAEVAALIARKRNVEGMAQAQQLASVWASLGPAWASHVQSTRVLHAQALLQAGELDASAAAASEALGVLGADGKALPDSLTSSRAWHLLAQVQSLREQWQEARASCVTALRIRMRLRRDTDAEVVQSLAQLADTLRSAPLEADAQAWQPTADDAHALATALRAAEGERDLSGLFAQADNLRRLKVWLFGTDSPEEAESLALVGNSYRREVQWTKAALWTQRAAEAMQRAHPGPSLAVVNLYSAAAEGHRMSLDPPSEWAISERAVSECRRLGDGEIEPLFRGAVYRDAGSAAARAGHHEPATKLLEEALEIFTQTTGPQSHVVANGHSRLAEAALLAGDAPRALRHALASEVIGRASASLPLDQRVDMLGTLTRALLVNGEHARAKEVSREHLEAAESFEQAMVWAKVNGQQWTAAAILWTASCAMRDEPEAAQLAARAREQWQAGEAFMQERYGRPALMLPPWELYRFPELLPAE